MTLGLAWFGILFRFDRKYTIGCIVTLLNEMSFRKQRENTVYKKCYCRP